MGWKWHGIGFFSVLGMCSLYSMLPAGCIRCPEHPSYPIFLMLGLGAFAGLCLFICELLGKSIEKEADRPKKEPRNGA